MQLFIILSIILKLFNYDEYFIYNFFKKKIIYNVTHNSYLLKIYNQYNLCYINKYKTSNCKNDLFIKCISNHNVCIPLNNNNTTSPIICHKDKIKSKIQLENNSINLLHVFYEKYPQYIIRNQLLYFLQIGIQNLLSNNTIILGIGKRYVHNNLHGIGYNTIINLPVLKNYTDQPYSINIGGEYWYQNIVLKLNGYYNLNKIIYSNKLSYLNLSEYPKIGYQICIQSVLPYITECTSHIKLEKFFYKKSYNQSIINNVPVISIGIGYKPVSMFNINIDNIFMNKKYINTLLTIGLNYQFNVPISHQIRSLFHNNTMFKLDYLNTTLKPFVPEIYTIKKYNDIFNILKSTQKIIGYPKEVKYIKITHNNDTTLVWNTESLERYGGKIIHLKDDLYKIHLPRSSYSIKNPIFLDCEERDKNNTIINTQKILVLTKKFQNTHNFIKTSDNTITNDHDQQVSNLNNIYSKLSINTNQDINTINTDNTQNNINVQFHVIDDAKETIEIKNSCVTNDDSFVIPIPPPCPKSSYSNSTQYIVSSSSHVDDVVLAQTATSTDQEFNQLSNTSEVSESSKHISQDYTSHSTDYENTQNLSCQLLIQKQSKFSSIGTQEYIDRLEQSIIERKKNHHSSGTGIEKILSKLHPILSSSSIEDPCNEDDDNDSFNGSF